MSLADKFERALRSLPRTRSVGSESGKNSNRRRNTYERFRSADESKEASEAKRKSKTDSSIDDTGNVDLEDAQSTTYRKKSPAPKTLEWAFMILNIDSNSSRQEIDSAYRKLAKQNHPDRVNDMAPEFSALAERKMKEINSAYEIIENELYG
jgi:DnaJ-domain-containing protein 1